MLVPIHIVHRFRSSIPKRVTIFTLSFQVTLPLLILHGEADLVTDPSVSKALYEKAKSSDKKLCLYKDAWHSLLEGEPDDAIFKALDDIISWLDSHSERNSSS